MKAAWLSALGLLIALFATSTVALATPTPTRTPTGTPAPISTPTPLTFRPAPTAIPAGISPLATLRADVNQQLLSDRIISVYKTLNFEMTSGIGVLDVVSFAALGMFSLKVLLSVYRVIRRE